MPKDNCWRSRLNQIVDLKGGFKQDGLTPTAYKTRDNVRRVADDNYLVRSTTTILAG